MICPVVKAAFVGGEKDCGADDFIHGTKAGHRGSDDEFFAAR